MRARRPEIEETILGRLVDGRDRAAGEGGALGLASAVSAGVSHGLAGVERGEERAGPIPEPLLAQVHRSARRGVDLADTLTGYFTGYTLFCDFILRTADEDATRHGQWLHDVLRVEAILFERVLSAVAEEHTRERRRRPRPLAARQLECVKRLLAGKSIDPDELAYEVEGWHVGAVTRGSGSATVLRELARQADRHMLLVRPDEEICWAWLGGRRRVAVADLAQSVLAAAAVDAAIALGEPGRGIDGWRLTHQQANTVLRVVPHGVSGVVRYADAGLLASISRDQVLVTSLHQAYLAPLAEARDGGAHLRDALRAYLRAGCNVSSAAAALGMSRQTVSSRLRAAEQMIGRTLESCAPEIDIALRLEDLGHELPARRQPQPPRRPPD
ncbi:MAG TPA: helix-turn-helix domain-containing protein [Solirubrobacterales bacterium]|nr:helix-turn-helix domain-containing protein [Solirubrobacterales bacterium]